MLLVLYLTLIEVAFGMALIHCFIPRSALGPGFGKTIATSVFFCLLVPLLTLKSLLPPDTPNGALWEIRATFMLAVALWFAYFTVLNYRKEAVQRGLVIGATVAQLAIILLTSRLLAHHFYSPGARSGFGPTILELFMSMSLGFTASAFLMGSVTMAMLIGHWYLVIPGLALEWLKGACLAFGFSIVFKLAIIVLSLAIGAWSDPFGSRGFFDRIILNDVPLFYARFICLLIPVILSVLAFRAAAMNSTQSSTGILFPAMIIVFLGEMIGSWLVIGLYGLSV